MQNYKMYTIGAALAVVFSLGIWLKSSTQGTLAKGDYSFADMKTIDRNKVYDFAGEILPKDNIDALERLERELLVNVYWHSNTFLMVKRSKRYFPMIEEQLKKEGAPDDLKYLVAAESSFNYATSPSGAKGLWQFLTGTAKEYGLEVSEDVDERNHPEKSTLAAIAMMKKLKEKFGSWTLAAAAYNMGQGALAKEMQLQRSTNYYDMNLNTETLRYVLRLVAIKEIFLDPEKYGFKSDDGPLYQPYDQFTELSVDTTVSNWGDFANKYGTNYRMLKLYNPWLASYELNNKTGKVYQIKIPKKI